MNRVMGYADRWSVAPGDTVRFMVSCLGGNEYTARIVRLKQPEAGPLATPFAPEEVAAPCNGSHPGRLQTIPIGSLAVVPAHPAMDLSGSVTLAGYVMPTTPAKGRQAIMGNWNEASETGIGLEIGHRRGGRQGHAHRQRRETVGASLVPHRRQLRCRDRQRHGVAGTAEQARFPPGSGGMRHRRSAARAGRCGAVYFRGVERGRDAGPVRLGWRGVRVPHERTDRPPAHCARDF